MRPRVDFRCKIPKTFIGFRVLQVPAQVTLHSDICFKIQVLNISLDDSKDDKRTTTERITMEGH